MKQEVFDGIAAELNGDEGNVLRVYDDKTGRPIGPGSKVIGWPTIARGRNLATRGLSEAESDMMLSNDIAAAESELAGRFPWIASLSTGRQIAIYSLYFNVALGNVTKFAADWPHFLEQMRPGEFDAAATHLETTEPWSDEVKARALRLANLVRYG